MRISQLLKELEEFKSKYGDLFVVVQYRDEDNEFNGPDTLVVLFFN